MSDFKRRPEHELQRFSDERLVDYIRSARAAGDGEAAKEAAGILAFGHLDFVRALVARKAPPGEVDDLAMETMARAVRSVFRGESVGELVEFLRTIARRVIADHHRAAPRVEAASLNQARGDDAPAPEPADPRDMALSTEEVSDAAARFRRALARFNHVHRAAIILYRVHDLSARETADEVNETLAPDPPLTETNVHKISSRFDDALEAEL